MVLNGLIPTDALTIDNGRTGLGLSTSFFADRFSQGIIDLLPQPVIPKAAKVTIDRWPRRKVVGQQPPGTPASQHVENSIDHFSHTHTSTSSPAFGIRDQWLYNQPLGITYICWVCFSCVHTPSDALFFAFCPIYITFKTLS